MTLMTASPTLSTTTPAELHQYLDAFYEHLIAQNGLSFRQEDSRTGKTDASLDLPETFGVLEADVVYANDFRSTIWRHASGALIRIGLASNTKGLAIEVAAPTAAKRDQVIRELRELLPARQIPPDREEVMISFWSLTPNGARGLERTIAIAPWERVQHNYTQQTKAGLDYLMNGFRPTKAGQLVLWYGPPGTGKTHALRALAWEWRKWCNCHYITDPEIFFGGNANYMLDVLLLRGSGSVIEDDDDDNDGPYGPPQVINSTKGKTPKWRLLILEDSGELMVPDAKTQTGQGLSRLLNVVDGLIGQGLRIMVLVTTNEILKKLHPAVARPGRCASRIEFGEFTKTDAGLWLANQNEAAIPDFSMSGPTISLAELYASIGEKQSISESKTLPVGFSTT
jgi:hypothetical protein